MPTRWYACAARNPSSRWGCGIATSHRHRTRKSGRCWAGKIGRASCRERVEISVDGIRDLTVTGVQTCALPISVRLQQPAKIIVAVPVGAPSTCSELSADADEVVCLRSPEPFVAVGLWYRDFTPTSDAEVRALLGREDRKSVV